MPRWEFKPLKTIITELTANNQVVVRYVNRPNCLSGSNEGDNAPVRDQNQIATLIQKVENINKTLANAHIEYSHENKRTYVQGKISNLFACMDANTLEEVCTETNFYRACKIPDVIEYVEKSKDGVYVNKTTYRCLTSERKLALDIIKKSQHRVKRERSWGKLQKDKTLTRNARQKILEAGAVIDKHVGTHNAFELTLTLPGSGWDAYDVVSRWSGYIVNRLTQIIRRAEKKGVEVHWFFVWEHQKRGALHMHWCIAVESDWRIANCLCLELRAKWFELLEELSVKTHIDLFKKRGFSGTWRHSPEMWQYNIARVRKNVAAYFSKYCGKHGDIDRLNTRRRAHQKRIAEKYPNSPDSARVYSLSPTRYWGCGMRTKRLCAYYRVTIRFDVASPREGDFICKIIHKWISDLSAKCTTVSRSFKKVAPDTGFIYCSGWEYKTWFDANVIEEIRMILYRVRCDHMRKKDAIGALLDLEYF